jgi:hypothetical protein
MRRAGALKGHTKEQATRACGHAIRAYERVRGDGPSVVPQEDL